MRHLEHAEQVKFFRLTATRRYLGRPIREFVYAIPNAGTIGGRRGMLAGVRRQAEGVTAGVPDIECMVAVAPYTGLHIEMKRKDGKIGDITDTQWDMIKRLGKCGRYATVAFGADHAWALLCQYLGIQP